MEPKTTFSSGRDLPILLHLSLWLLIGLLSVAAFVRMLPLGASLVRGGINTLLMAALFYGMSRLFRRYYEHKQWPVYLAGSTVLLLLITVIRFQVNILFDYAPIELPNFQVNRVSFFLGALITNIFIAFISFLYESILSRNRQQQRQLTLIAERQEAELQFLRAQMNPHFLFNTLNNIYSLAVLRSEKTAPLVMRLSDLLKYVIYEGNNERVQLSRELEVLNEYIDLYQLQHESPLNIHCEFAVPEEPVWIEPLLLVPIIENCFKHADFSENEAAFARIQLEVDDQRLLFRASNSYNPREQQKDAVGGVGLTNIRHRLDLRYPDRHELTVQQDGGVFSLQLQLQLND